MAPGRTRLPPLSGRVGAREARRTSHRRVGSSLRPLAGESGPCRFPHPGLGLRCEAAAGIAARGADLREVWNAPDRATAEAAIATFAEKYGAKYDKAVTCLTKDQDALLTFYDFPAEHWDHSRTSDGVQAGDGSCQDLAPAEGREPVAQSRPGRHIPQRRRGHQHASAERRLITASPRFKHSSCPAANRVSRCRPPRGLPGTPRRRPAN